MTEPDANTTIAGLDGVRLAEILERIAIGAVGMTTRALTEALPGVELTFPQWRAMLILGDHPDGARIGEVAARVGVTVPATSRLLKRLARRGLLDLSVDERDRRATRARLTPSGEGVRTAILAHRRLRIATIVERATSQRDTSATTDLEFVAEQFESYA